MWGKSIWETVKSITLLHPSLIYPPLLRLGREGPILDFQPISELLASSHTREALSDWFTLRLVSTFRQIASRGTLSILQDYFVRSDEKTTCIWRTEIAKLPCKRVAARGRC